MFWFCEPFARLVLRWGGSVTDHHKFLLFNQTYVLGNVRLEFFLSIVVGYFCLCCFYFFTTDIHAFIYFTLFLRGFFI